MKIALVWLLAALLIIAAGCENDDGTGTPPAPPLLSLSVNPDTLWFVEGETVMAEVTASLTNSSGHPVSGAIVHTSLSIQHNGWLTPADPEQGDTTDENGEIRYHYFTSVRGTDLIISSYDTITTSAELVAAHPYHGDVLNISLQLIPDHIDFSQPGGDTTVHVIVYVYDQLQLPVPSLDLNFSAQLCCLTPDSPTDSTGRTETWWWYDESMDPDPLWLDMCFEICASIGNFDDCGLFNVRR